MPLNGWGSQVWGSLPLRPDQRLNADELAQEKLDGVLAREDARYDAMSDAEREKYYLKPNLFTRLRRYFHG